LLSRKSAVITGLGKAVPEKVLTNADLEKMVETTDEWITQRVGIKERRIAGEGETSASLGVKAAKDALAMAGKAPEEIDYILVTTSTPDFTYPSTACLIQKELGCVNAAALDVSAACSGFVYAVGLAWPMIAAGTVKNVLVISTEVNSRIVDWADRNTCVLFGDGAGAALFEASDDLARGVLGVHLGGDGRYADLLRVRNSGTVACEVPEGAPEVSVEMKGNEVFKLAVKGMADASNVVLEKAGLTQSDIDLLIPHQANTRIIDAVGKRLEIEESKVFVNIQDYGNTTSATIPIAMTEAYEQGRIKSGTVIDLVAFGGGLTWGSALIRW
jgi:3-oxoacyl-[acyl-carrier-protein] synthase-3